MLFQCFARTVLIKYAFVRFCTFVDSNPRVEKGPGFVGIQFWHASQRVADAASYHRVSSSFGRDQESFRVR